MIILYYFLSNSMPKSQYDFCGKVIVKAYPENREDGSHALVELSLFLRGFGIDQIHVQMSTR